MAKKFVIPFAATGDKAVVPDALQPDGSVSYTQGFGPDYELDRDVDPVNAKDVPRDETNQLFFDVTDAIGEIQLLGAAEWSIDLAPYPINARVYHADKFWRSKIINNNGEPGVSANWDDISEQAQDFLNTLRVDVVSASTINLSAAAPNTRHINITGGGTINGFTVEAGQCYFARFNAAGVLTNGASLVTNRGANIAVAAGDSCIIRATSTNTVEIICGEFLIDRAIGSGQTIQVVTGSRAINTNYTNSTGRAIIVMASINSASGNQPLVIVDGVTIGSWSNNGTGSNINFIVFPVPNGSTYRIGGGTSVGTWSELR